MRHSFVSLSCHLRVDAPAIALVILGACVTMGPNAAAALGLPPLASTAAEAIDHWIPGVVVIALSCVLAVNGAWARWAILMGVSLAAGWSLLTHEWLIQHAVLFPALVVVHTAAAAVALSLAVGLMIGDVIGHRQTQRTKQAGGPAAREG